MNKKYVWILPLLALFICGGDNPTQNYIGKTPQQLSGFTIGNNNIGSTTWWYDYTFKQLSALFYAHNQIRHSGDYSNIQAAIDSGYVVTIDPGDTVAMVQDSIVLSSNIGIIGSGASSVLTLTKTSSSQCRLMETRNDSNIYISGLRFVGDSSGTYDTEHDHQFLAVDSKNIIIENCIFEYSSGDNIYLAGSDNVLISNCIFTIIPRYTSTTWNSGRNNIAIVGGNNITITNCKFRGGNPACIDIEPNDYSATDHYWDVNHVTISNCVFGDDNTTIVRDDSLESLDYGFRGIAVVANSTNSKTRNVAINGNTFYCYTGVELDQNAGDSLYNVNIVGNTFRSSNIGVWLYRNVKDVNITGNTFNDCNQGITLSSKEKNVLINGNIFRDCTTSAIYNVVVAANACTTITITNNSMINAGTAINLAYPYAFNIKNNTITESTIGIQSSAQAYHLNINGNTIAECSGRGIYLYGGTSTRNKYVSIVNNQCYNNDKQIEVTYTRYLNCSGNTAYDTDTPKNDIAQIYLALNDTLQVLGNFTVPDSGGILWATNNTYGSVSHNFTRATGASADYVKWDWHQDVNLYNKSSFRDVGELTGTTYLVGTNSFTGTVQFDTVVISGVSSSDYYIAVPRVAAGSSPGANDILGVTAKTDTIIVSRPASGTSGLNYNYMRINY